MSPTLTIPSLPESLVIDRRVDPRPTLFVGDIQGCLGPLNRLLDAASFDPAAHRLIPLGDTLNRGPDSLGTLRRLRALGAEPILGNHELGIIRALGQTPRPRWVSKKAWVQALLAAQDGQALLSWVATWPHARRGDGWIAVHAGLHPTLPLHSTPPSFAAYVRVCDAQGNQPTGWDGLNHSIPPGYAPWHHYYHGPDTIIFGHWARMGLQMGPHIRGLDTGAVYGGKLTALWWPEDRLVQVDG